MASIKIGPTGKLIQGHLYDVNKKSFEDALRRIDRDLYLHWNPKKRRGLGCWEIRCRPQKTWIYQGSYEGKDFYTPEQVYNGFIHHVKDVPFLAYEALNIIDLRDRKSFVRDYEYKEQKYIEAETAKIKADLKYGIKQHKGVFKAFRDMVQSGVNPALLAKYWGQSPT